MSFQKELLALFGNGRRDNIIFTLNAGETMTLNFTLKGINTATNKFYDLRKPAKKVMITVNKVATITKIGGKALQFARTLGTDNVNTFRSGIEWDSIVVGSDQASTIFEVYAS